MPPRTASQKLGQGSKHSSKFATAEDIRRVFRNPNETAFTDALLALRNQLTVKSSDCIAAGDDRLLLANAWLESDPGLQDLFTLWEQTSTRQLSILTLILSLLSSVVTLSSSHYTNHSSALPILRSLLSQQWSSKLNSYFSTTHNELILVTLKLYNALSAFGGGRERRSVLDAFPWELKSLPKLLHMRRRAKGNDDVNVLDRPDIRTYYVLFLLSFVDSSSPTAVKVAFLEQRRDTLQAAFKGLPQDTYPLIRRVLELCWTGLWCDAKLKRTLKVDVFNENTVQHLLKIYDRNQPEGDDPQSVAADVVHHFLLAISTRPGTGICFKDQGWYPPDDSEDKLSAFDPDKIRKHGGRVYNKILAGVLKALKVNEDARQQELAIRILEACPELVAGYWHAAALTLEPRLSSKWIANVAFFGSVISLPVPSKSFLLPGSTFYRPAPPPLSALLENILPSVNIKVHLSRGLQSQSALVQHCAALALAKCLVKYGAVVHELHTAAGSLEEDEEEGRWTRRLRELEREISRRVPECQVIVAFAQQKTSDSQVAGSSTNVGEVTKNALLAEVAQRLLWLYHQHLPWAVAETRFDVGKVLQRIQDESAQENSALGSRAGLTTLTELHILRLLQRSDDFSWANKSGSSRGNLSTLLRLYARNDSTAVRHSVADLLRQTLSTTTAFQHDAGEVLLWLRALPSTKRAEGAKAPDGTPLTDETTAVITFLDDCLQRCIKTPYRYFEELQAWQRRAIKGREDDSTSSEEPELTPSPLLTTVLEQFQAKISGNLLAASDILAIVTFIRKLVRGLAGKLPSLHLLHLVVQQVDPRSWSGRNDDALMEAVARECNLMKCNLAQLVEPTAAKGVSVPQGGNQDLIESQDVTNDSPKRAEIMAYELIDELRLINQPISHDRLSTMLSTVEQLHKPATVEVAEYVFPGKALLWGCRDIIANLHLDFSLLFLDTNNEMLADFTVKEVLVQAIHASNVSDAKRALRLVNHRLTAVPVNHDHCCQLLSLLTAVMKELSEVCATNFQDMKRYLFTLGGVRRRCEAPLDPHVREALEALLQQCLNPDDNEDLAVVAEWTKLWSTHLAGDLKALSNAQFDTALTWLPYADIGNALALFDHLSAKGTSAELRTTELQEAILANLVKSYGRLDILALSARTSQLLQLQATLPHSASLDQAIVLSFGGVLPAYHDGQCYDTDAERTLAEVVAKAYRRWGKSANKGVGMDVQPFLARECWTASTATIVARITYCQRAVRPIIAQWITTPRALSLPADQLAVVLDALVDSPQSLDPFAESDDSNLNSLCDALLRALTEPSPPFGQETHARITSCLIRLSELRPSLSAKMVSSILQLLRNSKDEELVIVLLSFAARLSGVDEAFGDIGEVGLKWVTETLSSEAHLSSQSREKLGVLLGTLKSLSSKTQQAESVILVALQQHLSDREVLSYMEKLLGIVQFKPATINRFLQTIIQNPNFHQSGTSAELRTVLMAILHLLFHLHPSNTCQPSHVEPLRAIYGGSLSQADRLLASIFHLFEVTRKSSIGPLLCRWSPLPDAESITALEAIQSLDPPRVFKTCLDFPQWYDGSWAENAKYDERLYDPSFILLLFAQMLVDGGPSDALGWVQLFRSNTVSLLIRALSSQQEKIRTLALAQLAGLYGHLQGADMQEKPHVIYILDLLRNVYTKEIGQAQPPRISAYTTLHLAHALRGVFYPSSFTYPITSRFLLQRPEFDIGDVPTLYTMLYSVDDQWKRERAWIVRFLADGMVGRLEWKILKRRHTWDLVGSIFQSEAQDHGLRRSALEFLANLTCNKHATMSLVLNSSLFSWIEIQLQTLRSSESLAWARILENIIAVVDVAKVTAATGGEWWSVMCRCLLRILADQHLSRDVAAQVAQTILRLSHAAVPELDALLSQGVRHLTRLEAEISARPTGCGASSIPAAPHSSKSLWQTSDADPMPIWGYCLETLWRAAMNSETRSSSWDALTSRLLVWRAFAGENTPVGEFARREVACNLAT